MGVEASLRTSAPVTVRRHSPLFAGDAMHEKSLFSDGWASFDPLDFEGSLKKKVLDAEQALMLAILRNGR